MVTRDCKALLVTILIRVKGAVTSGAYRTFCLLLF